VSQPAEPPTEQPTGHRPGKALADVAPVAIGGPFEPPLAAMRLVALQTEARYAIGDPLSSSSRGNFSLLRPNSSAETRAMLNVKYEHWRAARKCLSMALHQRPAAPGTERRGPSRLVEALGAAQRIIRWLDTVGARAQHTQHGVPPTAALAAAARAVPAHAAAPPPALATGRKRTPQERGDAPPAGLAKHRRRSSGGARAASTNAIATPGGHTTEAPGTAAALPPGWSPHAHQRDAVPTLRAPAGLERTPLEHQADERLLRRRRANGGPPSVPTVTANATRVLPAAPPSGAPANPTNIPPRPRPGGLHFLGGQAYEAAYDSVRAGGAPVDLQPALLPAGTPTVRDGSAIAPDTPEARRILAAAAGVLPEHALLADGLRIASFFSGAGDAFAASAELLGGTRGDPVLTETETARPPSQFLLVRISTP